MLTKRSMIINKSSVTDKLLLGQNGFVSAALRWGIIAGVILTSAYVVPRQTETSAMAVVGLAATALLLRWPPLGLLALVVASLLIPFGFSTGTGTDLNLAVLLPLVLVGVWIVETLVGRRQSVSGRQHWSLSHPALPLLALCLVAVAAFVNGSRPMVSFASTAPVPAQLGGLAVFLVATAAFLLGSNRLPVTRWLPRITWLYLSLAGLYVLGRLLPGGVLPVDTFFLRGATANSLFWVWIVVLATGQSLYNRDLPTGWRVVLGSLAVATLYVAFFQARGWVSGWFPPLVGLVVTLWMGSPRLAPAVSVLGGLLLLFDQSSAFAAVDSLLQGENSYSLMTRLEAWRIMEEIVKVSPILGLGPANYYWYTPLFPILGWKVSFSSHNNYVDIAAQTGILGLICFLWFAVSLTRSALRARETVPVGFGRAYLFGALGGLAGTLASAMLADWLLPFVYNIGLSGFRMSVLAWVFLGGLVAVSHPHTSSAAEPLK